MVRIKVKDGVTKIIPPLTLMLTVSRSLALITRCFMEIYCEHFLLKFLNQACSQVLKMGGHLGRWKATLGGLDKI